jgi:hypothetical protein
LSERYVVRAHLHRNTVHLLTAATTGTLLVDGLWQAVWTITRRQPPAGVRRARRGS